MIIEDEESLQMYVEESQEHLSNIENDLLEIEKAGDDADIEIINNVFRAAHSIKGGAGLMGLNNIKQLAHKVENVLGMIREKTISPDSNIISILLSAFDKLRDMVNNIKESETVDISEEIVSLTGLTTASLPETRKSDVVKMVDIFLPGLDQPVFQLPQFDINEAQKGGETLYIIEWDLIQDVQEQEKSLMEITRSISTSGNIIETKIALAAVGTLDHTVPSRLPFLILYASMIGKDILTSLFNVESESIHQVTRELMVVAPEDAPPPPAAEVHTQYRRPDGPPPDMEETATESAPADSSESLSREEPEAGNPPDDDYLEEEAASEAGMGKDLPFKTTLPPQTSLRVDIKLLDGLMTLAGEMVLSRNRLLQSIASDDYKAIAAAGQRINMVTSELQDVIMRTRMQPIGNIFNKFPRLVRDMSRNMGKKIELTIEGTEVELDKTIIESISEPLNHLIRNSVDHGIEPPGRRQNNGKNPIGKIHLAALHEAGQVSIEIKDDGKGIDGKEIAAIAVTKGLITARQAESLSEKEKTELILLPGFSTSETVTDVSGRGVGMDVVKTNIEKLGGTMEIDSMPGLYTLISIKLPLTLAIIPSQIVAVGSEKFAIPQVNLDELLRIPAEQVKHRIEKVGDAEVVRLRGRLLPLVDLAETLEIQKIYSDPETGEPREERRQNIADRRSRKYPLPSAGETEPESRKTSALEGEDSQDTDEKSRRTGEDRRFHTTSAINVAVVFQGNMRYGLIVDRMLDSEEIVVKPLGKHVKQCQEFTGATIMGDGKVALIIDITGVAQAARLNAMEISQKSQKQAIQQAEKETAKTDQEKTSLLLFGNGKKEQFAVSLALVERIESVQAADIEHVGGKKIIQYRGGALPLFSLDEATNVKPLPETDSIEVIVFSIGNKEIGLMVVPPVDAIEASITIDSKALKQTGIMGSAIINNQTTMILDIFEAVKALYPDWVGSLTQQQILTENSSPRPTCLFAEDSDFFRRQVKGFLEDGGYRILDARDGQEALERLNNHLEEIDLVITDLEMPVMDGFELTERIRADARFQHLNVIALTSLAGEEDIIKGKRAGINDYQIKMDREKLLDSVKRHLKPKEA